VTPEEATAQIAAVQANDAALLPLLGPAALEGWQTTLEVLEGLVNLAKRQGYPDELARQMVATQWMLGIRQQG
jgi:hypothetical protein